MELIRDMKAAIMASTLPLIGEIEEFLPVMEIMTFTFDEGLTVEIAAHANGLFQARFDGLYYLEPTTASRLVAYLENI